MTREVVNPLFSPQVRLDALPTKVRRIRPTVTVTVRGHGLRVGFLVYNLQWNTEDILFEVARLGICSVTPLPLFWHVDQGVARVAFRPATARARHVSVMSKAVLLVVRHGMVRWVGLCPAIRHLSQVGFRNQNRPTNSAEEAGKLMTMRARTLLNRALAVIRPRPRYLPIDVREILANQEALDVVQRFNDLYYTSNVASDMVWRGDTNVKESMRSLDSN